MVPNKESQKPMVQNISCILPQSPQLGGLYLGNVYGAQNAGILKEYGIRAVITTSAETSISHDFEDIPFHLTFDGHDKEDYYISQHVNDCIHFIQQNRKFTNVLVHCYAGVSRSSAIICAYLMWKYRWNLNKTLEFVKFKRIVAKPNDGFMKQLADVEVKLGLRRESSPVKESRSNVQRILSPKVSQVQQILGQMQMQAEMQPDKMRPLSVSRPASYQQSANIQKSQSPPLPQQFQPQPQPQKMQPFAQLAQMQQSQQPQYQPQYQQQTYQQTYHTLPSSNQQKITDLNSSQKFFTDYGPQHRNSKQQQQGQQGFQKTVYRTGGNNEAPIPRFLNRRSQYSSKGEQTKKSIYNDYMSPQIKPTSPRLKYPPKHSIGKMNSTVLGSPIKPMNELSNTYGETSIYSTNYSKKATFDSMEKSKTASRCLVRPRDLPGYRTGSRNY